MKKTRLPFRSGQHLRKDLLEIYLHPAVKWIADVQDPTNPAVLPVKLGNIWETAISILILYRFKRLMAKDGKPTPEFDEKITRSVEFLLSKVKEDADFASWDDGLYDTSLAVRALLYFSIKTPGAPLLARVEEVIEKGIIWLCREVESWESERYSLGVADLAQVLQTLQFWKKVKSKPLGGLLQKRNQVLKHSEIHIEKYVLDQLINALTGNKMTDRRPISPGLDGNKFDADSRSSFYNYQTKLHDDREKQDIWNISEAVMGLVQYYNPTDIEETQRQKNPQNESRHRSVDEEETQRLSKVAKSIHQAVRYLELEHSDGKWGLPDTTALALLAYLRGHSIWENLEPEPQIVFKTIRWLCDDKQHFTDNSILHNTTHTLFFCLGLIELCERWIPAGSALDLSVEDLYDFVLWQMPARTSAERAKRLNLQDKLEKAELLVDRYSFELEQSRASGKRWKLGAFGLVWAIVGIVAAGFFGFLKLDTIPITSIPFPSFVITQWQELFALVSIWLTLGFIAGRRIIRARDSQQKTSTEDELENF